MFGRREEVAREAARGRRSTARHAYVSLDERWSALDAQTALVRSALADDDALRTEVEDAHRLACEAVTAISSVLATAEHEHDPDDLDGRARLETATHRWGAVAADVDVAATAVAGLDRALEAVDAARTACRTLILALDEGRPATRAAIATSLDAGYDVDALTRAADDIDLATARATEALDRGQLSWAHATLRAAAEQDHRTRAAAEGLPGRDAALRTLADRAEADLATAGAQLGSAETALVDLEVRAAAHLWRPAAEEVARARRALDEAHQLHRQAVHDLTAHRFDEADAALDRVEAAADLAERAAADVAALRDAFETATARVPAARAAALAAVEQLREVIGHHPHDVDPALRAHADDATRSVAAADSLQARQDPEAAIRHLDAVRRWADGGVVEARHDVQVREAQRAEVAVLRERAGHELDRARVAAGLGVFGQSKRDHGLLDRAAALLQQADEAVRSDPAHAEALVRSAGSIAEQVVHGT